MAHDEAKATTLSAGFLLAVFLLGFGTAFRPVAGMDFHWHIGMGRAHLEHGPRLADDPHTHLPLVRSPDMGEWGAQVLFASLERTGGVTAVRLFLAAHFGLACVLAAWLAARHTRHRELVWFVVAVFVSAALLRLRGRPDVFSISAILILRLLLERAPSPRTTGLFFLLGLVWVNLHPGVVAAPILIGACATGGRVRDRLVQILAVTAGACCSPNGPGTTLEIAWLTASTGHLVPEFRSPFLQPAATFFDEWALIACVAALTLFVVRQERRRLGAVATALAGLAFAVRSTRLLYMLVLPVLEAVPALDRLVADAPRRRRVAAGAAILLIAAFPLRDRLVVAGHARDVGLSPFTDLYEPRFPVEATEFLESSDLRGNLFHPVAWGGYLGLHLAPRHRTAHDGRITLFGEELAARLLRFGDARERDALVEEFALEILVMPPGDMPQDERWLIVHADPVAAVAIDREGPNFIHNAEALH